jgi:putative PIN family toxin of toxin-antitoxin system
MRVVLDTNIIVSSFLVALGASARIIAHWRAGLFDLVVSPALLAEYEEVLGYGRIRRRHRMTPEQIAAEIADIRRFALLVEPQTVPSVIADDPDDDHVLACALAGHAHYIVSGDPHLLNLQTYQGIRILSPAGFVALLAEEL